MGNANEDAIRIGRHRIELAEAKQWVTTYTDARRNLDSSKPYAYPAYDLYRCEDNPPDRLDDADFLAPELLNVNISIESYYALQRHRDRLQQALAPRELASPLANLSDAQIDALVGDLFAILDDREPTEPSGALAPALPGIGATKLSKVLHRKRPASIPLHDRWVRACYVGPDGPVPVAKRRSWRKYMVLIAQAMAHDLTEQPAQFAELQSASRAAPALTDLRLLDILAWNAGQNGSNHPPV